MSAANVCQTASEPHMHREMDTQSTEALVALKMNMMWLQVGWNAAAVGTELH